MAAAWAQILLLACIAVISASQSCNDVICCPGEVCVEETFGRNGTSVTSCVTPTSCRQLQCPNGFVCIDESQGFESTETGASCQASCNNVQCPGFLQCVEKGTSTECVIPEVCSLVKCPRGTSCQVHEIAKRTFAACLGQSCNSIQCSNGSICDDIDLENTNTGSSSGQSYGETATCLPKCDGADICPQGMVCEEHNYKITCREPQSCAELDCPTGQICEEVMCGTGRARQNITNSSSIVRCVVDITQSSGSGTDQNGGNENEGNETDGSGADDPLTSSASSMVNTKQGTLASAAAALILCICTFFLLHL